MKKLIVIILIIAVVVAVGLYFYNNSSVKKAEKEERGRFGGRTKQEVTDELKAAWKLKWLEANTNWIMVDQQPQDWLNAIRSSAEEQGDTRPLEEIAAEHSIMAWAKDNPKANDKEWGRAFVWTYSLEVLGLEPNSAEVQEILVTI